MEKSINILIADLDETEVDYIKISEEYLKRKDQSSEEFALVQSEMIKENDSYNKKSMGNLQKLW